jgi:hypothetical protein
MGDVDHSSSRKIMARAAGAAYESGSGCGIGGGNRFISEGFPRNLAYRFFGFSV